MSDLGETAPPAPPSSPQGAAGLEVVEEPTFESDSDSSTIPWDLGVDVAAGIPLPPESPPRVQPALVGQVQGPPEGWARFLARPAVQELLAEENPLSLQHIWEAWDKCFDCDPDRPSPEKERARRCYDKFFPVEHQYKVHIDEGVIAAADQMIRAARLSETEMKSGKCKICKVKFWPDDLQSMDDEPDMLVRILCGHIFHRNCISEAFLRAFVCPLCAHIPKKDYQLTQPYPLSWDGEGEEDGAAGLQEQQDGAGAAVGAQGAGAEGGQGGAGGVGEGGGAGVDQEGQQIELSSTEEEQDEDELLQMMYGILSQKDVNILFCCKKTKLGDGVW